MKLAVSMNGSCLRTLSHESDCLMMDSGILDVAFSEASILIHILYWYLFLISVRLQPDSNREPLNRHGSEQHILHL